MGRASRKTDLKELADALRAGTSDEGPLDAIAPIPISTARRRQFSVSQLESLVDETSEPAGERVYFEVDELFQPGLLEAASLRGSVVHAALERVSLKQPGDLESLVRQCLAEHNPAHQGGDVSELVELIERFLASETGHALAGADVCYREMEFLLRWPPEGKGPVARYLRGYIDCLYRDRAGWHLVDFKTNRITTKGVAATAASYHLQLVVYAIAAERMVGEPLQSVGLYFLEPEVRWDLSLTAEVRRKTIEQAGAAMRGLIGS